ncbi:MAG: 50S ribosomal protein L11 methyltransferase [Alphaproteobacteria bacterium]|nr:50S ribosomal protein L11 methyltransferase [Alphaproteobacteria bacterium]
MPDYYMVGKTKNGKPMNQDPANFDWPVPKWRITLECDGTLSGALAEKLSDALEQAVLSVFLHNRQSTDGDDWVLEMMMADKPDKASLYALISPILLENGVTHLARENSFQITALEDKDWLRHVHDNFPPITAGGFFIYGTHYEGDKPDNLIPLQIDAATAFGSGEHDTTSGCLDALEHLKTAHTFKNALDMGCGSGILAIAARKLWPDIRLTAIDIDPESINVTQRHAAMNGLDGVINAAAGDGYATPLAAQNAPYDLVCANILSGPLIDMAPALSKVLGHGGITVLSGLLTRQKDDVIAAHTATGLSLITATDKGDWSILVLQKPQAGL